jgi:hypothetical protein
VSGVLCCDAAIVERERKTTTAIVSVADGLPRPLNKIPAVSEVPQVYESVTGLLEEARVLALQQ